MARKLVRSAPCSPVHETSQLGVIVFSCSATRNLRKVDTSRNPVLRRLWRAAGVNILPGSKSSEPLGHTGTPGRFVFGYAMARRSVSQSARFML